MTTPRRRVDKEVLPMGASALPWLFFTSGALALVYEVVWQRQFALVLGSAAPATAAVLAAYFAGLGLGSVVLGRCASRWRRPLRVYAMLEAGIGLGALLVTPLVSALEHAYGSVAGDDTATQGSLLVVRLGVAFAAILVPTFCMGGTLPVLGAWLDRGRKHLGLTAGWLYVANTTGAALGALSVPFWLLPAVGLRGAVWTAAALNGLLALAAWWLDRRGGFLDTGGRLAESDAKPVPTKRRSGSGVGWLAAISGAATFALQVLWNRAFAQVHENSMHSFAVIVALVILALAVGGQIARMALKRAWVPKRILQRAWMMAGIAIMAGPWFFHHATGELAYLASGDGGGAWTTLAGLGALMCFVPMVLLSVALPALMEVAGGNAGRSAADVLGRLLAMNVAGSVAGALVAGFVLPAWIGLWSGLIWLGAIVMAVGAGWGGRGVLRWATPIVAVAAALALRPLEPPRVRLAEERGERLVDMTEGAHGIVSVVEREGSRRLKLNNHYALGGTAAVGDERMQAHLPLLLHARPRTVAFLGLGTGVTASGALFHPVERVVAVELVPEVIAAARAHFTAANESLLEETRVSVIADDARHFLRGTSERFDVIVGDLVVPWRAGEGALFTLEQFQAAHAALGEDGLFCQWLPLFQLSEVETEILLRTFLTVFPRAEVWRGDFSPTEPAIALVGRRGGEAFDARAVREQIAAMVADPANPHLSAPGAVWMHCVGVVEREDLRPDDMRVNSENWPWVELLGPRLHGGTGHGVFVGRPLEAWLATLRARTLGRGPPLGEEEMRAMEAGAALAEMILRARDGDRGGAAQARDKMRQLLPAETTRALLGAE